MNDGGRGSRQDRRDEEMRRFVLNYAKGHYDGEIEASLGTVSESTVGENSDEGGRPSDWEERKALALKNLKIQLQKNACRISRASSDVGDIHDLSFSSLLIQPWQHVLSESERTHPPPVPHDQSLVRLWTQLSTELKLCGNSSFPSVLIRDVQLTERIFEMLMRNLKGKVEAELRLDNNCLCRESIAMLSTFVEDSPSLGSLQISYNSIRDLDAVMRLTQALKTHPNIVHLSLQNMDIGNNTGILSAILGSDVQVISLSGNSIGSQGAAVISEHLESNPPIERLELDGNKFNDDDIILFALSLRKNSNLRWMNIVHNDITSFGAKTMLMGIFDSSSLNRIWESNHTCGLCLFPRLGLGRSPLQDQISEINAQWFGIGRMNKMLIALHAKESLLQYLEDMPVELMPDVLAFIQAERDQTKLINMIYATMRWWDMPSLYIYHGHVSSNNSKRKLDCIE